MTLTLDAAAPAPISDEADVSPRRRISSGTWDRIAPDDQGHGPGGRGHSDISTWVEATFTLIKAGADTVYDLRAPAH